MLLVAVWVDPGARNETAVQAGEPRRDAGGDLATPCPARPPSRVREIADHARDSPPTPSTAGTDGGDRAVQTRALPLPAGSAVPGGLGPGAPNARRRDAGHRARRRRHGGTCQRRRRPARRRAAGPAAAGGSTCAGRSGCGRSARRSTSTAAGRGRSRWPAGTRLGKLLGEPVWRLLGGRQERLLAYASTGELASPVRAGPNEPSGCATPGCGHSRSGFTTTTGGTTSRSSRQGRGEVVGPEMAIMVDANQGWRMPGDTSPPWDLAAAVRVARALEPLEPALAGGAAADRRHRRLRRVADADRRADRCRRAGAGTSTRRATCWPAAAST